MPTPDPFVIVVDDDDALRNAICTLIKAAELDCLQFSSARDFLADYLPPQRGCLVLEVRLPGMSGLELQQELNLRGDLIPVIFLTAHGDIPMAVEAMRRGAFDFLQKPFRDEDLLVRIQHAIAKDGERRQSLGEFSRFQAQLASLTPREREVLEHITQGKQNKIIGQELGVSPRTVEIHRARIMKKMNAQSVAELVRMMLDLGDTPMPTR
jgi:FixJ family two-component response regulator